MGEQRHGQSEHEHRPFRDRPQCAPFGIRRMHRQGIVGKGAAVVPGHQQQRQDQRQAGDDPQGQGQHPAGDEQNRGKNAVDRSRHETVLAHRRHVAVIGFRQVLEQQGHDDDGREQRGGQVGAGEDRHPRPHVGQERRQPGNPPADQDGHRLVAEQPVHHQAEPVNGQGDPQDQRNQCRCQHVSPDAAAAQARQRAHQGQNDISHVEFLPIVFADV